MKGTPGDRSFRAKTRQATGAKVECAMGILAVALAITLVIEVPIVAAFYRGHRVRMAIAATLANIATNLAMNALLVRGALPYNPTLLAGEGVALAAEAIVYGLVAPGRDWAKAITASAAANLASFAAGLLFFR